MVQDCLAGSISNAPAYVPLSVGGNKCYGLVDSGAMVSLCTMAIFGKAKPKLDESRLKVRGVTGNYLKVLGMKDVELNLGGFVSIQTVHFVENMADNVFILGRDILNNIGGIVNYRDLELRIGDVSLPLMRPHNTAHIKHSQPVLCQKTVIIPPYSEGKLVGNLRGAGRQSKRSFSTVTGVIDSCSKNGLVMGSGVINSHKGRLTHFVRNPTNTPLIVYRNQRLGYFQAFHACEINSLNTSFIEWRRARQGGRTVGDGGRTVGDGGRFAGDGGRTFGVGGRAVGDGGRSVGARGRAVEAERRRDMGVYHVTRGRGVSWNDSELETTHEYNPADPVRVSDKPSGETVPHKRWVSNIDELFKILKIDEMENLSNGQRDRVKSLIAEFRDIFSEGEDDVGCTDIAEQEIILDTNVPIRDRYYNIPIALRPQAEKEVKRLLDLEVLQPSTSPYHSPSFLLKRPDGNYRLLTDFRKINRHIVRSWQPIPGLEEMVVLWNNCKYYSKIDFIKGFYQTKLKKESRKFTATSIPGCGFFEYVKSPLGLSNSPCFFQTVVERMLMGLKNNKSLGNCVAFLDDVMSGSPTFEGMMNNLRAVFGRILQSKMLLKAQKCELFKSRLRFLGVMIDENGLLPCPTKVEAISKMAPPTSVKGIRTFLGMAGFFRRFIKDFSLIAEPLTRLTKKNSRFQWTPIEQKAWQNIKDSLASAPVLSHPDLDKPFWLITDASAYCIGAILAQKDDEGKMHPVSFGSSILSETQRRWSTVQRELYALVHFCEKYSTFLLNREFHVITDNKSLLHLDKFKATKNDRLWRWFETLQNYKFTVEYAPTAKNPSDALSRLPRHDDPLVHTLPESDKAEIGTVNDATTQSAFDESDRSQPFVTFQNDTLKSAQENDRVLSTVKSWLTSGDKPKSSSALNRDLYTYYHSYDRLSLKNDVIVRSWEQRSSEQNLHLVCIPESLQKQIISAAHDIASSGHLGHFKTMERIRSKFYFPKMDLKVKLHLAACHVCMKRRNNVPKLKAPITPYNGRHPGHIVQLDLIENLPVARGYKSILVIVDTFSKWAEAIPLRDTKVEHVAKAFVNIWCCRQGLPSQVHTDRGGNVDTADLIKAVYDMLKITKTSNTAHRPQTDGGVERLNRTIKNMLWKFCQKNPKDWVDCLDQVMFAYRTSVHSATGFSPFFIDKGRLPRLPVDAILGTAPGTSTNEHYGEAADKLYNRMRETFAFVEDTLQAKQISSKQRYDTKAKVRNFEIGSWVYVWKPVPQGCTYKKFYDHYRGPFKIVEQVTTHTYKIVLDEAKNKFDIVHMEMLKDAKIPVGQKPAVQVKHYSEDMGPEGELASEKDSLSKKPILTEDEVQNLLTPKLPFKLRRQGTVVKYLPLRRSTRIRTQHVPYQHRG